MNRIPQWPLRPDITIIGGGVIGLMAALNLREAFLGAQITVLDKGRHIPNPYGTSTRSAACTRQQFGCEHNVAMSMFSTRFYERFRQHTGETMQMLWQKGYLFLYRNQRQWEQAEARIAKQQNWGLTEVRALSPDEVAREFPCASSGNGLVGATFCPTDGYLSPGIILSALKDKLTAQGVKIMTNAEVVGFTTRGDRVVHVNLDGASVPFVPSDIVVNCAGPWSRRIGNMLGTHLCVAPEKRFLWTAKFADPAHDIAPQDFSRIPMIVCMADGLTPYIRPEPGSQPHSFLVGCEHQVEPNWNFADEDQDRIDPNYIPPMGPHFEPIWQTLSDFTSFGGRLGFNSKVHGGHYETTPCHNPYITYDPSHLNVIHACGFSGHGVMHAPAAGKMVADLAQYGDYRTFRSAERSVTYQAHVHETGLTEEMKI